MGSCNRNNMIKTLLVVCFAALSADDKADALYGAYGYAGHLGYAGHYGYGVGHMGYAAPVHHVASNVANSGGIHGAAPAAVPAVHGAYAGAGRYVANSAGTVHVAKREAEADAFYTTYGMGHLGHGGHLGYGVAHTGYAATPIHHGVTYTAPVHHAAAYAAPVHHAVGHGVTNVANTVGIHGVAPAAIPAVHGAKREAEANPDAYYNAYGFGGYGLGHRVYSHGYGHHLGYSTLGYGHGFGYGHGYGYYG